jgi:diguanylate cyclase (GGDEF)-like protein
MFLVYLLSSDPVEINDLATQIEFFGYTVEKFTRLDDLKTTAQKLLPNALVLDLGSAEDVDQIFATAEEIQSDEKRVPLIFITEQDHINNRLKAVRTGSHSFFVKPVNVGSLIDALDQLAAHQTHEAYRIIIVDTSRMEAQRNATTLKKAGMIVDFVLAPLTILSILEQFSPDLILMNVDLGKFTGIEIAQIIRQIPSHVSIPIVFLSAELDRKTQLEAMSQGGDDFLSTPIEPDHLIRAITTRVERYRTLRRMMRSDGLTGLLNHTSMKERLEQEFLRAARQKIPLSFVMIDLDHFKQVNDTYGHPTGDQVLKSISRLLKQRLRRSDVVGRYGGEEFAVIMPETDCAAATMVMDEIRSNFEHVRHRDHPTEFSVTFSAGVASYPDYQTPVDVGDAADRALYEAKRLGRNRVVCASQIPDRED